MPEVALAVEKLVPTHFVVAFDDHVSVEAPPLITVVGDAVKDALNVLLTVTVVLAVAATPPASQEML